jgi:hypothetical protein
MASSVTVVLKKFWIDCMSIGDTSLVVCGAPAGAAASVHAG